MQGISGTVP